MKRNVRAKRKVMGGVDVNKSPEMKFWIALYTQYYLNSRFPVAFIYDVAWSEIANKRLKELKEEK